VDFTISSIASTIANSININLKQFVLHKAKDDF